MSREDTLKTIMYVGEDPRIAQCLAECRPGGVHRLERCRTGDWPLPAIQPSWRCCRVVVLDHLEQVSSRRLLESLFRHDAGIPVVVLMDGEHPECMTYAGLARMYGAHRLVLKPLVDRELLADAVESAFQRMHHWALQLNRPCTFEDLAFQSSQEMRTLVDCIALAAPDVFCESSCATAIAGV